MTFSKSDLSSTQVLKWLLIGLLLQSIWACNRTPPPLVEANSETLEGVWEGEAKNIAAFKGVPYAAAPVGDLRWRAPQAPVSRQGEQDATDFAPGCMQNAYTTDWYGRVAAAFGNDADVAAKPNGVSEDCLYLNIWSPQTDEVANLPVMVWVHGGSNFAGWSYEPNYIGARLAAKGVVVVTISYRMGAFGFFSHPVLDNGPGQPIANFGWLDAQAAFKWVSQHIQAFGGDPNNITEIGESSGAGDIADWVIAELTEDRLAHRAIGQSPGGTLHERRSLQDEQKIGEKLINSLGIKGEISAQRLRAIPADKLMKASAEMLPGHYYEAVLDGLTLKERPIDTLNQKKISNVDFLIGTNADEWYMYLDPNVTHADLVQWVNENAPDQADALLATVQHESDVRRAMDRLISAKEMLCLARQLASKVTRMGGRGWVYHFTRQRSGEGGEALGSYHGAEIPYVFGTHDAWLPTEDRDRELTDTMMDYWVQFARTGDPNIKGRPGWPVYTSQRPYVMELGDEVQVMEAHDTEICALFGEI